MDAGEELPLDVSSALERLSIAPAPTPSSAVRAISELLSNSESCSLPSSDLPLQPSQLRLSTIILDSAAHLFGPGLSGSSYSTSASASAGQKVTNGNAAQVHGDMAEFMRSLVELARAHGLCIYVRSPFSRW